MFSCHKVVYLSRIIQQFFHLNPKIHFMKSVSILELLLEITLGFNIWEEAGFGKSIEIICKNENALEYKSRGP